MFAFSKEHCYGDAAFPEEYVKQYCLENKSLRYLWGGEGAGGMFPKPSYKLQFPLCSPRTCTHVSWTGSWKTGGKTPTMTVFPRLPSFCSIYHGSRNKTHSRNLTLVPCPFCLEPSVVEAFCLTQWGLPQQHLLFLFFPFQSAHSSAGLPHRQFFLPSKKGEFSLISESTAPLWWQKAI